MSKGGGASDVHDWQPIAPVALPPGEIVSEWPSSKVSAWLTALGLSGYAPSFAEHRITGDVLEVLTEAHLVQLGVELIGHRVLLMREIQSLRRAGV